jgi:low temperature requirement protein LtrA
MDDRNRSGTLGWAHSMVARRTDEAHRASTPLELLFDLCFVVAVSQAAAELNHSISNDHLRSGIIGYLMVFFAIWWAWVNFTWFASAYDTDDVPYRLLTFVQIAGALILAAGVASAFDTGNFTTITIGYVVMRLAMVAQWLRAAASDPAGRSVAHRFALGITVVQVGWVVRLFLPRSFGDTTFCLLAAAEIAVPLWAERGGRPTTWHPAHISERYGLFTLIVLGESVSAATIAIQSAVASDRLSASLVGIGGGGLILVFGLWWWYFEHSAEDRLRVARQLGFVWSYAHYVVFAAVAAFGAGLEGAVTTVEHGGASTQMAALAVAIPVGLYLSVTATLHARFSSDWSLPIGFVVACVALVVGIGIVARWLPLALCLVAMGVVVAALVALESASRRQSLNA